MSPADPLREKLIYFLEYAPHLKGKASGERRAECARIVDEYTRERCDVALAALQRVEEVLEEHADSDWGRRPQTQEIRDAIADIDTMGGGVEVILG